jgi:N-acetylglucosaminyl-diphospho-decaprenol L-rhamnosyltransferase
MVTQVRVGIVSWNTAELLGRCLAALPAALAGLDAEVVVIDNDSADGSADVAADVAARSPTVRLVRNRTNVGYAKAMNQALAGTDATVLIALNPDTEPPRGSLAVLVDRLLSQPDVGLVAPRLVGPDGRLQHSVYRFPSPAVTAAVCLVPTRWQRGRIGQHFWLEGSAPHDRPADVDWPIGAVHVIRSAALGSRQPYDERWFMYVEDIELCWWLARNGWRRRLEADVAITHVGNASGAQAWGESRSARYYAATYDWYARDRGAGAARRWAVSNTLGLSLQLALRGFAHLAGYRGQAALVKEFRRLLPLHARAILHPSSR